MIRYSLACAQAHAFDSWFRDAAAYAALEDAGQLSCPVCGSAEVKRALMAPAVQTREPARAAERVPDATPSKPGLSAPANPMEQALAELRRRIEATSDYVGMNFVAEARRMHAGEAPERSIYGEARPEEARQLLEDGVPVAPLPFLPVRKAN